MVNAILSGLLSCTLINAVYSSSPRQVKDSPVVDLGYAQYRGVYDTNMNVTNYRGVRYAASPTGDLRWRAPQAPKNIPGIQQANTDPPSCFQAPNGGGVFRVQPEAETEDCLFVNIASPGAEVPSQGLSVVVWIHGGGYVLGNASQFQASDLMQDSRNSVVSVVIQYRLGLFGFLAGSEVKEKGVLNAGLLDQKFALRWVQENISKFGGDPTKVTIWGQSAGGGSVLQHVIAEDGRTSPKLFKAAITSSTYLPPQYRYDDDIPEHITLHRVYIEKFSLRQSKEIQFEGSFDFSDSFFGCSSSSDTVACLRATDTELLASANVNINSAGFFGTYVFVPVVDGTFITRRPIEALKQRKLNTDVMLAVANTNEGVIYVNQTAPANVGRYARDLFPTFGSEQADVVVQLYKGLGTELDQVNLVMGEAIFICPTYFVTRAFKDRAFKGQFAVPPALHGDDVVYYFPTLALVSPANFNNSDFQKAFSESFLSFVVHQDPNARLDPTSILPQWNTSDGGQVEMVFNRTNDAPDLHSASMDQALLERCSFWESVAALTGQ
ncbi:hypothetical protein V5O48_002150 [Marasmius crinis-equi]|uniref:Carboxylic ester hydrolase n=1 Tax=Marasmius crinis-equi TaxID=585013 RepID=A0ABR3FWI0_9AGAR